VLADLGAEVIKVEPLGGDNTRRLLGSGAGFFALFNRNKKSIALDLQTPQGREIALKLVATADIVSENFKPGTMQKLGLDYASLSRLNEGLIYVSHKGFLPGPYDHRTALDEVVQMMGGLAYMTGRPGDPLRAGTSVNDIMGGMFGAIGATAALAARAKTGKGQEVQAALFENNVFLVAQHMMQFAVTGQPAAPMPGRISAWGIYDVFTVQGGAQIFLAVVSDTQWQLFCDAFGFADLRADPRLDSNNDRVRARDWLLPLLRERLAPRSAAELSGPGARPADLLRAPHRRAAVGGWASPQGSPQRRTFDDARARHGALPPWVHRVAGRARLRRHLPGDHRIGGDPPRRVRRQGVQRAQSLPGPGHRGGRHGVRESPRPPIRRERQPAAGVFGA